MSVDPPSVSRELIQCYQRAYGLMHQRDPDWRTALQLLVDCVLADPFNLIFVETFLYALGRLDGSAGSRSGRLQRFFFRRALARQRDDQVVRLGPPLLLRQPRNVAILCGMAEACSRLGHEQVGLRYARTAATLHPDDPRVQRQFARSLTQSGLFPLAAAAWQRVVDREPNDIEAQRWAGHLAGFAGASDPIVPAAPLHPNHSHDLSDAAQALAVAEHMAQRGEYQRAVTVLTQAGQANPGDLRIREMMEDVSLAAARRQLEVARQTASAANALADASLVDRLEADLLRREIAVFEARASRYPGDHRWTLQLGKRLKQVGNFAEARRTLDTVPLHSPLRPEADLEIGECLQHMRRFEQALASYEASVARCPLDALGSETGLRALYRAGSLAMDLGNAERAVELLQRLARLDARYKDVAGRLDKLEQIRHKD